MAEYYSKEQLLESGRTTWCDMYDLEDFLTEVPTADVVPKSEVENIFEDIEREIKNHGITYAQRKIAELKKKYTEGKT